MKQLTIRGIPDEVEKAIEREARIRRSWWSVLINPNGRKYDGCEDSEQHSALGMA